MTPATNRKPVCGAKTRRGTSCQCKKLLRGGRCKLHGGMSTGPRTPEGKVRSAGNLAAGRAVGEMLEQLEV